MEAILIYILKSAGLLSIFYIGFLFLFKNDTSFNLNRYYLAGGLISSAVLPSVYFTKKVFVEIPEQVAYTAIPESIVSPLPLEHVTNWWEIAGMIYFIITGFLLLKFFLDLYRILHLIWSHKSYGNRNFKLIETTLDSGPFSFFNYIFFNPAVHTPNELDLILKHEKVHSRQWHTLDILSANFYCCLLWFNPLAWSYKKSIVQNLEYIADRETVASAASKKEYFQTLLKVSVRDLQPALTNSFYQSFIKKRIIMLNKSAHSANNMWKLNLVFPAILAFMFTFNLQTEFYAQKKPSTVISNTEVQVEIDKNTTQEKLDDYIKLMNEHNVILKFEDVQYNNDGLLTNIKVEFIDRSNISSGTITKSNPSGIEAFLYVYNQKEGSRFSTPKSYAPVISSSGTKNVTVRSYNPSLKDSAKVMVHTITSTPGQEPIFIIDGKVVKLSAAEIDTENMSSISVLKGASAVSVYGKEAKDGAIIMTTKKHPDSASYAYTFTTDTLKHINAFQNVQRPGKVSPANNTTRIIAGQNFYITSQDSTRKPLYIVDGKEMGKDYKPSAQDPHSINSIQVTKGDAAVKKYGERAKDGAVEITTKSSLVNETPKAIVVEIYAAITEEGLRITKEQLLKQAGMEVKFENIKRNKEDLITNIKITAIHKKGKVSAIFSETGGIPKIYVGLKNDQLIVSSNPPGMN